MNLQDWANKHKPDEGKIWEKSFWNQIVFVRDDLPKTLISQYNYNLYEAISNGTTVLSSHTSKSILLPVYSIVYPNRNLKFIARNNFYDWKVSVISDQAIEADFSNLFSPSLAIPDLYCEGFKKTWVFESYSNNNKQFTVELSDDYSIYTFFWLIRQALKLP